MQRPRRSILTGQPVPTGPQPAPAGPAEEARPGSAWGPAWLLGLAVLLLLLGIGLLAAWQVTPDALPFVPRTATLTPSLTPTSNTVATLFPALPTPYPTTAPNFNPSGSDVSQDMQWLDMLAGGYGWGAGRRSIWRTNDGGQTWQDVTPPLGPVANLFVPGDDPAAGGMPAATPTPLPAQLQPGSLLPAGSIIRQAFFHSRMAAWFLLHRPGLSPVLYATSDGGQSWRAAQTPFGASSRIPNDAIELFFADEHTGWAWLRTAGGPNSARYGLYRTLDGGQTWEYLPMTDLQLGPYAAPFGPQLAFADTTHGWLAPSGGQPLLFATADGGLTWQQHSLNLPPGLDWASAAPLAAPHFEPGEFGPGVLPARVVDRASGQKLLLPFTSLDGGRTWQAGSPMPAADAYSIPTWNQFFLDSSGILLGSQDGGQTWIAAPGSFRDGFGSGVLLEPEGLDFIDSLQGWAWQRREGRLLIFTTTNAGQSWRRLDYTGPAGLQTACRWQAADFKLPLLPISESGPYQGWSLYLNPAQRFSMKVAPGWWQEEIVYACPGQERDVHRVVLRAPEGGPPALLALAFRPPDQPVPLLDPDALPGDLQPGGQADFYGQTVPLGLRAGPDGPVAVFYNEGREIAAGGQALFTAVLESDRAGGPDAPLAPDLITQAGQMLASLAPLQADEDLLAGMDVETSFSASPDGLWEVEVLLARPLAHGPLGYSYQRVTAARKDGGARLTALDSWVRQSSSEGQAGGFTWSPDGRWLYLYQSGMPAICPQFAYQRDLRRLDLQTGQVQELNLYPANELSSLAIAPDASRVAYLPPDYLSNPRVVVRDLSGEPAAASAIAGSTFAAGSDAAVGGAAGPEVEIAFETPIFAQWGAGNLSWSPDGQRLVFAIAAPYCAQQGGGVRAVVLVDPQNSESSYLTDQGGWLEIERWLPDGRLRLAGPEGELFSLDLSNGQLASLPPDPPDRLAEAESVLRGYFMMLHNTWFDPGTYQWAADHYGGSYDVLASLNSDIDPRDRAALFQRACEVNGFYCLRLRRVLAREIVAGQGEELTRYRFTIELMKADGSLFTLRGRSQFEMTVVRAASGEYRVMELPPR